MKKITFRVDEENGCETCWDTLRGIVTWEFESKKRFDPDTARKIREAVGTCPHNPPEYARSILIEG